MKIPTRHKVSGARFPLVLPLELNPGTAQNRSHRAVPPLTRKRRAIAPYLWTLPSCDIRQLRLYDITVFTDHAIIARTVHQCMCADRPCEMRITWSCKRLKTSIGDDRRVGRDSGHGLTAPVAASVPPRPGRGRGSGCVHLARRPRPRSRSRLL